MNFGLRDKFWRVFIWHFGTFRAAGSFFLRSLWVGVLALWYSSRLFVFRHRLGLKFQIFLIYCRAPIFLFRILWRRCCRNQRR